MNNGAVRVARFAVALAVFGFFANIVAAQSPKEHVVFQSMLGDWKAEGELRFPGAEQVVSITEQWNGKFDDEGKLVIKGRRILGETEQSFRWIYYYNAALEFYEVLYRDSSADEEKTFQVSVNQSASSIELQIPMGDGGTTLNLRSKVQPGTIESVVTIVDASGSESGGGKIVHTHLDAATAGEDSTGQKGDAKP